MKKLNKIINLNRKFNNLVLKNVHFILPKSNL